PVPEELQNGAGFGYVVAFRPFGATGWMQAAVPSPEASKYVFKNETILPFTPFQVKVGVYNNKGEGPFGPVVTIYSAEEEPGRAPSRLRAKSLSAFDVEVYWKALPWSTSKKRVLGYEVLYKRNQFSRPSIMETNTTSVELSLPTDEEYIIQIRPFGEGGEGSSSRQITIPKISGTNR
ncbi:contactin-3-like, partial [Sinocyclocheilus grahami]|uniref:contactin-3-like n=1 Tax=Sinocyclocheilus grahami TaxID=75366 RepID=UPI0007AD2B46